MWVERTCADVQLSKRDRNRDRDDRRYVRLVDFRELQYGITYIFTFDKMLRFDNRRAPVLRWYACEIVIIDVSVQRSREVASASGVLPRRPPSR